MIRSLIFLILGYFYTCKIIADAVHRVPFTFTQLPLILTFYVTTKHQKLRHEHWYNIINQSASLIHILPVLSSLFFPCSTSNPGFHVALTCQCSLLSSVSPLSFPVFYDLDTFEVCCSTILYKVLQLGFVHCFLMIRLKS